MTTDRHSSEESQPFFGDLSSDEKNPLHHAGPRRPEASSQAQREAEYAQIQARLRAERPSVPTTSSARRFPYAAAAAIALLMAVAVGYGWLYYPSQEQYATAYGETRSFTLPDQSVVTLNANSTLRFAPSWEVGQAREVWLDGEAYFSVQKQSSSSGAVKFVVHTPDLDVEVLGTQFNVAQRASKTQVVLEEGSIRVDLRADTSANILMQPGDLVEYSAESHQLTHKVVETSPYVVWKENKLILNNKTIREIAELIQTTYGFTVEIQDSSIADLKLSGTIRSDNVDLILDALAITHGIEYRKGPDRITLQKPR
ncbi:ferric-dicitrate binding protein FerR, regulates iron transport through sigma-19 [Catalinimonas alkaloidigena]|uniref:Ferric-dicitrate binding protein FerR, regulates iron transport through sigma-19 n=1 Tax=Catalinimonas alkaloidigena TaxID=1075417 RepID=A0A1G9J716_9BACT|nr:FecR domain-containing protein [Catalinimonas alkaloidigena]SDL33319.1 ferric-dicitrate binding protein FerR, regulates iron transport through sigma-19 [Catalinimonas alkaloidigena]